MSVLQLLVVIVPAGRRNELVDTLMAFEGVSGFTRTSAAGFSKAHSHFSVRESVQGYVDQERFELVCPDDIVEHLLAAITGVAGRDAFFYWRLPLVASGVLTLVARDE